MRKNVDFSVIIVNYRSSDVLGEALASFVDAHQFSPVTYEVIIADTSCDQPEKARLEIIFDQYRKKIPINTFFIDSNVGFGAANNKACRQASGKFLLFLNPDVIVNGDILSPLASALSQPSVGVVSPVLRLSDGSRQKAAYGNFPSLANTIFAKLSSARVDESSHEKSSSLMPVNWVSGACLAISRDLFEQLGGFDQRFFMYFEDVDLCWRVSQAGYQCLVLTDASIIHLGGERRQLTRSRRGAYFRSQSLYFRLHRPLEWPFLLFIRLPYQVLCFWRDLA